MMNFNQTSPSTLGGKGARLSSRPAFPFWMVMLRRGGGKEANRALTLIPANPSQGFNDLRASEYDPRSLHFVTNSLLVCLSAQICLTAQKIHHRDAFSLKGFPHRCFSSDAQRNKYLLE